MIRNICFIILFTCFHPSFSQNNSNCINALDISGNIIFQENKNDSSQKKETNNIKEIYSFEKNKNSLWFKFIIPNSTEFALDISPKNSTNDYDFIIYKYEEEEFCDKINTNSIKPIRSNLSRYNTTIAGKTGLSFEGSKEFIPEGPGDAYGKAIKAKKGETYYLTIDNFTKKDGTFSLLLYLKEKIDTITETQNEITKIIPEVKSMLNITVVDEEKNLPIKADIDIEGLQEKPIKVNDKKQYSTPLKSSKKITINCNAKGYLLYSTSIVVPSKTENISLEIKLKKIKAGESVLLPQIKFEPENAIFLASSSTSLKNLLKFLQDNPKVKIEIQGHVNGPNMPNSVKFKKASKDRAKSVYDYLVTNGIEKNRLNYKGFGNEFMIFPNPDRETQSEQNRRVEIKIISLE